MGKWINYEKRLGVLFIGWARLFTNKIWDELFSMGNWKSGYYIIGNGENRRAKTGCGGRATETSPPQEIAGEAS